MISRRPVFWRRRDFLSIPGSKRKRSHTSTPDIGSRCWRATPSGFWAVLEYSKQTPSSAGWRKAQRKFRKFQRSANDFFLYTDRTGGAGENERKIASLFGQEKFIPVCQRWLKISDALRNGKPVSFNIKDLLLTDEPMTGTMQ